MYLLRRYLQLRYRTDYEMQNRFTKLIKTLINLKYFARKHRERIEEYTDPSIVSKGLLTEIFELNSIYNTI